LDGAQGTSYRNMQERRTHWERKHCERKPCHIEHKSRGDTLFCNRKRADAQPERSPSNIGKNYNGNPQP